MNTRLHKLLPALLAAVVIVLVCLLHALSQPAHGGRFTSLRKLEWITYDWRVRQSYDSTGPAAPNLAAVFIDDQTLATVNSTLGFSWPFPRQLHGRVAHELAAQGARATGFDILFAELHPVSEATSVKLPSGETLSSDDYFARRLRDAGNVTLAVMGETRLDRWHAILPATLFRTNAAHAAHIVSESDPDGVLRRALPFRDDPVHGRIWNLGFVLAARYLGMDLSRAVVEPRRLIIPVRQGGTRVIPLNTDGTMQINWELQWNDPRLLKVPYEHVLATNHLRLAGATNIPSSFQDRLVVIGSIGSGNNISDVGATPLQQETYLVSKHWNVANSLITGRHIRTLTTAQELLLVALLGILAAAVTVVLRPLLATLGTLALAGAHVGAAVIFYTEHRWWIPVVIPVGGALLLTHFTLLTWRLVFATREQRRVKGIFSKIVSPNVVHELLEADTLSLGGSRRRISIFFADVRGFTELTDAAQQYAEDHIRTRKLTGTDATRYLDEQSAALLATVNLYLGTIANVIKQHDGTLDKYIGDCVMAFWGAPTPNEKHALSCVYAAIAAQRAIHELNQSRALDNFRIQQENERRAATGQAALQPHALLALGTGINTGDVTVGLMGSDAHILNYTVFGREVNLASRLEGVSGRSRIIIGEATYLDLQRDDPALAATCLPLPAVQVKGFRAAVQIYEVPWKPPGTPQGG